MLSQKDICKPPLDVIENSWGLFYHIDKREKKPLVINVIKS